ncbi:HBR076Cp [Eremothecium sinecaudum]|uniref:Pre-mRNA-splicing factor CLF1 n=1 Tax=Eremothecium sinecaudum TaxID=45286 RepID=A0A120K139_9SACH|nr:HBR076Cp [Eremothecium sinecaudum]AMD18977.1 HBR076Cp [Eremothecium sinecaudum]
MEESSKSVITADGILADAFDQRKEVKPLGNLDVLDLEELKVWQRQKRTEYEDVLKRNRLDLRQWIRYAEFELQQHDIRRARSVFERALLVRSDYIPLWVRYIDSELKWKNVNHARNLLHRATNHLPKVDTLWYKYVFVEESLGHVDFVRGIYTKWCSLEPSPSVWDSFIDFEIRHSCYHHVRDIYSKYVMVHCVAEVWLKWVSFESRHGGISTVRKVYSLALDTLTAYSYVDIKEIEQMIISFANWEASQQEYERSRSIYSLSVNRWPESSVLKDAAYLFEKKFGNGYDITESIIVKRKRDYEAHLSTNPIDYDSWWLYLDLIEENFGTELESAFEKATIRNIPITAMKDIGWRRYIYIWIRYLAFLELHYSDIEHIRATYQRLIKEVIPHNKFTFAKIWIMNAKFEIRQGQVTKARKLLGMALGLCPKRKLFKYYIQLEIMLKEFDRVRKLYEKYLEFDYTNLGIWCEYAELESNLGDEDRARGIYELALKEEVGLSHSDRTTLFERYIQFETNIGEYSRARKLYDLYLIESDFASNVWVSKALYEISVPSESQLAAYEEKLNEADEVYNEEEFEITDENLNQARQCFESALKHYALAKDSDNRVLILEAYKDFEYVHGSKETQDKINKRLPKAVTKRLLEDGIEKEFIDYIFPDDLIENTNPNLSKFVALAHKWNKERKDR